jgi:hypothetical protein
MTGPETERPGDRPTRAQLANELENAPEPPRLEPEIEDEEEPRPKRGGLRNLDGRQLPDCPVTPLGRRGDFAFFLDSNGQLRQLKDLGLQGIQSLFAGRLDYLYQHFPKIVSDGDGGFKPKRGEFNGTQVSHALWDAAGRCGVFNPDNAVRGVGAWRDDDGGLIYHTGDAVLHDGKELPPGEIEGRIYAAAPPIPRPLDKGPDPVPDILETLKTWNWAMPDLHPQVALGMIAAQMMCGALEWRPTFWLTAPAGSGKSAFQDMLRHLHGDGGLVQSTDATKSGITSRIGHSSLPVALDELEPGDERSNKERDIITLARVASSGGEWSRGSSDQSAVGGKVYSSFLFSSILIPGIMKSQDVQRLIRLDMGRLENATGLNLVPKTWRARGARLKSRLMQRWPSLEQRIQRYRHALELEGVMGRNADNWQIVLALADMATTDALPDVDRCGAWAHKAALLVNADREEVNNDADAMLAYLLGQTLDPFRRGEQYTVGQWIQVAAGLPGAPSQLLSDFSSDWDGKAAKQARANELLSHIGLRVYEEAEPVLFIANTGPAAMNKLFEGSEWNGGAWKQSAARVPNAYKSASTKTLAAVRTRGTMVPLASIPALNAFPETKEASTAARSPQRRDDTDAGDWV